jgi:hypothetical protein
MLQLQKNTLSARVSRVSSGLEVSEALCIATVQRT